TSTRSSVCFAGDVTPESHSYSQPTVRYSLKSWPTSLSSWTTQLEQSISGGRQDLASTQHPHDERSRLPRLRGPHGLRHHHRASRAIGVVEHDERARGGCAGLAGGCSNRGLRRRCTLERRAAARSLSRSRTIAAIHDPRPGFEQSRPS